ncbi:hypothetical protein GCM10027427_35400 [Pseudoclavibacter terrae]
MPPFLRAAPHYTYGIPTKDGRAVKLGLGFNDHFVTGDASKLPRRLEGEALENEIKKFDWIREQMLPGLAKRPYRVATYVESYTTTMFEHIKPHPENEDVLVMAGFSGHGFRVAPAVGEIGAQLIMSGKSELDIGFLDAYPKAFEILDSFEGLTTHNSVMTTRGINEGG